MSETLKTQLIYEIAEELIQKFDVDVSKEILNIINKHLYNYDVIHHNLWKYYINKRDDMIN